MPAAAVVRGDSIFQSRLHPGGRCWVKESTRREEQARTFSPVYIRVVVAGAAGKTVADVKAAFQSRLHPGGRCWSACYGTVTSVVEDFQSRLHPGGRCWVAGGYC